MVQDYQDLQDFLLIGLFMDCGLLTMAGQPDILEYGGNPNPVPNGILGGRRNHRVAGVHQLAAALDSATPAFPAQASRPGESTVAAAREEPGVRLTDKRCWYPPSPGFDSAAPLCWCTPKQLIFAPPTKEFC